MGSNGNDELEKFKSHLQVYEGLLRDQAAEIASPKAENAYLKKQLEENLMTRRQPAVPHAAQHPVVKAVASDSLPPTSVVGSSHQPFVIDESDVEDVKPDRPVTKSQRQKEPSLKQRHSSPEPSRFPKELRVTNGG